MKENKIRLKNINNLKDLTFLSLTNPMSSIKVSLSDATDLFPLIEADERFDMRLQIRDVVAEIEPRVFWLMLSR